jgi:hypothetical protein
MCVVKVKIVLKFEYSFRMERKGHAVLLFSQQNRIVKTLPCGGSNPGASPTIVSYNSASVAKIKNAANSMSRFYFKIFLST